MINYYNTYAYYDNKGRRLAVFCRYLDALTAEIFTITCSKDEPFKKAFARAEYDKYLKGEQLTTKPTIKLVSIEKEQREISTLLAYCRSNYYVKVGIPIEFVEEYLVKYSDFLTMIKE